MNKKLIILVIFVFAALGIMKAYSFNLTQVYASTINKVNSDNSKLAVVLVIDNSGSMAVTDPQKLRETAADIFIDLLSTEDYLGIITFNAKEEVAFPIGQIQSSDNKANLKSLLAKKIEASGDTNYLVALKEARNQLDGVYDENARKVILFLTDGEPDPDNGKKKDLVFMNSYMDSLWKEVSNLALSKYQVYSVGFSKEIDRKVLERISNDTKGEVRISNDSSELAANFSEILGKLINNKSIPQDTEEGINNESLEYNFEPENKENKIESTQFEKQTKVISKTEYLLTYINGHDEFVIKAVEILIGISVLLVFIGLLFYRLLVYKNRIIKGKLIYWKESDTEKKEKRELQFNQFKKNNITITFNEKNEGAEYKIPNDKYIYDLELTVVENTGKLKFIEGYKALFYKDQVSELLLKTTKPGIFIYEDKIYSRKKIYNKDKFITGEYVFQYFSDKMNKSSNRDKGKNVLKE